jgi:hypothetical protein
MALMTKKLRKNLQLKKIKFSLDQKQQFIPSYKKSLQPSKENIQRFKT